MNFWTHFLITWAWITDILNYSEDNWTLKWILFNTRTGNEWYITIEWASWQINVHKICDESGDNCKLISQIFSWLSLFERRVWIAGYTTMPAVLLTWWNRIFAVSNPEYNKLIVLDTYWTGSRPTKIVFTGATWQIIVYEICDQNNPTNCIPVSDIMNTLPDLISWSLLTLVNSGQTIQWVDTVVTKAIKPLGIVNRFEYDDHLGKTVAKFWVLLNWTETDSYIEVEGTGGKIKVHRICDENGENCKDVSNVTTNDESIFIIDDTDTITTADGLPVNLKNKLTVEANWMGINGDSNINWSLVIWEVAWSNWAKWNRELGHGDGDCECWTAIFTCNLWEVKDDGTEQTQYPWYIYYEYTWNCWPKEGQCSTLVSCTDNENMPDTNANCACGQSINPSCTNGGTPRPTNGNSWTCSCTDWVPVSCWIGDPIQMETEDDYCTNKPQNASLVEYFPATAATTSYLAGNEITAKDLAKAGQPCVYFCHPGYFKSGNNCIESVLHNKKGGTTLDYWLKVKKWLEVRDWMVINSNGNYKIITLQSTWDKLIRYNRRWLWLENERENIRNGWLLLSGSILYIRNWDLNISNGDFSLGIDTIGTITSTNYWVNINNGSLGVNGSTSLNGSVVAYQWLSVHDSFAVSGTSLFKDIATFTEGVKLNRVTTLGTCNQSNDWVIKYANIGGNRNLYFCVCASATNCQRNRINMTDTF